MRWTDICFNPYRAPNDITAVSLEDFVFQHDELMNTATSRQPTASDIPTTTPKSCLRALMSYAHLTIMNSFKAIPELERHLDEVNLLDSERLRPGWDGYFMASCPIPTVHMVSHKLIVDSAPLADLGLSCIAQVELYETPCRRHPRSEQADLEHGIQWDTERGQKLQRRRL